MEGTKSWPTGEDALESDDADDLQITEFGEEAAMPQVDSSYDPLHNDQSVGIKLPMRPGSDTVMFRMDTPPVGDKYLRVLMQRSKIPPKGGRPKQ